MKKLLWLTVLVLAKNFSAQAADKQSIQFNSTSAGEIIPPSRFNTLTVKPTANGILLNWQVEETANLQYFLVEHAVEGQNFSPLFEVPVQSNQHAYSFVDAGVKALDKPVYYRVKAIYPTVVIESPVRKATAHPGP